MQKNRSSLVNPAMKAPQPEKCKQLPHPFKDICTKGRFSQTLFSPQDLYTAFHAIPTQRIGHEYPPTQAGHSVEKQESVELGGIMKGIYRLRSK